MTATGICQAHCGAGIIDEEFFAGAVDLAHGTLERFGKAAVVLAELGVAVDGFIGVLFAELLPLKHQGHAFALDLLVQFGVVGRQKGAGALGSAH